MDASICLPQYPNRFVLLVHGGAGYITRQDLPPETEERYLEVLKSSLLQGYGILKEGKSSEEAVIAAVKILEDCPLFNAGKGSVFNSNGEHELEAAIMSGDKKSGAVVGVKNVKNPILLAQKIKSLSIHSILACEGASDFARTHGIEIVAQEYFHSEYRYQQWQKAQKNAAVTLDHSDNKFGTVGAVALDQMGHLCAATSTGGMTNKLSGRVGDTPLVGAGTYANNHTCAVSCTGKGELFIRECVGNTLSNMMEFGGISLKDAVSMILGDRLPPETGGIIAVDGKGNFEIAFNTKAMYRGSIDERGVSHVTIFESEKCPH